MRKVVLGAGCLLMALNAQASLEGNALVGVSLDYARYDGRYDIGLYYTGIPVLPKSDFQDRQRNTGFGGGLLAGYQFTCNDWVFGLEMAADWFDTNKARVGILKDRFSVLAWDTRLQSRNKGFYSVSARAGYQMAAFFLSYLRLGVEATHHEMSAHFQGAPNVYPFGLTLKDDQWQNHVFVGVGAEFPLPVLCHLSLRMEYNYHFPCHTMHGSGRIIDGVINPAFTAEAKPAIDTGKVSLVWNF